MTELVRAVKFPTSVAFLFNDRGGARGPVIVRVFKTREWRAIPHRWVRPTPACGIWFFNSLKLIWLWAYCVPLLDDRPIA